jgi:hypothetical protein
MSNQLENRIIDKAKRLGADLVGLASVEALKDSPSHTRSRPSRLS